MNRLAKQILLPACAVAAMMALSACGGGDPAPQQPTAQTLTFASPANQTFGVAPAALVATASSGLTVSFASTTPSVCTVSGTALSLAGVGTCTVQASQAGNATFAAATAVSNSFSVAQGAQTISFISPGNQTLGTTPAALMATATSGLAVSFASTTPSVCTVSGTALTLVGAGTCSIGASQAGNSNYVAAPAASNTFTVAAAPLATQTITFTSPGNQTLGSAPAPLAATSTSGLAVSFASTTPGVCTVSGTTLTLVSVGSCSVAASQAGNSSFAGATMVTQTFSVAAAPLIAQTISFISPGNQTLGTAPAALVATASSGLPVSLSSTTPGVCTASGTTLTLLAVGSCTISASQAGNSTYASAPPVSNTFNVAAAPLTAQAITFDSPGNQTLGTAPPALVASSTSGLVVTLTSTTMPVCTVNGSALTLVAAGNCTVVASQAGNSTYAAAAMVSRTFAVAAPVGPNAFANGGFEDAANGAGEFADGWQGNQTAPTRSSAEAHSGTFSAKIAVADPGFGGSGLFQNSVDHGQLNAVAPANWGTSPTLTFWIKGNSSETGDLNYALRYLNSNGNILNTGSSQARTIWTGNTVRPWTQITLAGIAIPANTTAVFLEMTLAVGPTGITQCGVDNQTGQPVFCDYGQAAVYLDDVSLPLLP